MVLNMVNEVEFTAKQQALTLLNEIFSLWDNKLFNMTEKYVLSTSVHPHRTIKDDIAHLWIWQRVSVARLEAALSEQEPVLDWLPKGLDLESDSDLHQINEWIFDSNKDKSWSEVYQSWRTNFLHLISLSDKIDESTLLESSKFLWLDGYPLIAVLAGTYNHHTEHFEKLEKSD